MPPLPVSKWFLKSHVFLFRRKFLAIHQACLQYHKHIIYAYKNGMYAYKFIDMSTVLLHICLVVLLWLEACKSQSHITIWERSFFSLFPFSLLVEVVVVVLFCFFVVCVCVLSLQTLLESYQVGFLPDRDRTLECQMKSLNRRSTQSWGLD